MPYSDSLADYKPNKFKVGRTSTVISRNGHSEKLAFYGDDSSRFLKHFWKAVHDKNEDLADYLWDTVVDPDILSCGISVLDGGFRVNLIEAPLEVVYEHP